VEDRHYGCPELTYFDLKNLGWLIS
jgi:hypothetical protein